VRLPNIVPTQVAQYYCCFLLLSHYFSLGPLGVAPIHNVVVTALSHSLGANLAFLNLRRVEKVRDLALQRGVSSDFLSKANIVAALLDACEDSYVETAHPAVVVIDGPPGWLLSDEAASEVVLGELKSVSSRVMFLAVPPRDTLRIGDFAPSARPPPPAPAAQPAPSSPLEEIFGGDAPSGSSFSPFANLFDPAAEDTPAEENAANGANNKDGPVIPPWFQSPSSSSQTQAQQQMQVPQGTATPPANVAGRLGIQMVRQRLWFDFLLFFATWRSFLHLYIELRTLFSSFSFVRSFSGPMGR